MRPTGLMANLGYGRDYQYAHDAPEALVSQEHLPDALRGRVYYRPTDRGAEKEIAERLGRGGSGATSSAAPDPERRFKERGWSAPSLVQRNHG